MWLFASLALSASPPAEAVLSFVEAGDRASTEQLETVLHDQFRVVAQMPDGLSVLDRSTYLGLIKKGVIGGVARTPTIATVATAGGLATVTGTLESQDAEFECTWTVVEGKAGWQVIQDMVIFTPKAKKP